MNKTPNKSAKSVLSRLLASENIFVVHNSNAKTASFDIKNRVLTLPVLKDMSDEMYDMFIGHEVSHALYTPFTDDDKECLTKHKCLSAAYKVADGDDKLFGLAHSYVNVVEDARIERLIKDKFPGIRRDFYVGYGELFKKNFFGTKGKDISSYSFIDRINLYFKVGTYIDIPFTDEEMEFVDMVESTRSFDDVVDVSKKIWKYVTDKKREEIENAPVTMIDIDFTIDGDADGDTIDVKTNGYDNSKNDGENQNKNSNMKGNKGEWTTRSILPDQCSTQQEFDRKFASLISNNHRDSHSYHCLPTFNENSIVDFKELLREFDYAAPMGYPVLDKEVSKFIESSNKVVNILAQAFHAKKAAKEHHRSMIHRTGVIDTVRMMNYKINDDIFKRLKTTPKGKSHGLVFYMDLSGSMSPILEDTFKQLIQLVLFCKRVNIPFEVYGFSTKQRSGMEMDYYGDATEENFKNLLKNSWTNGKSPYGGDEHNVNPFTLVNLFSSKMTKMELNLSIRNMFACFSYYKRGRAYSIPPIMHLSSTPLIESIVSAMDIVPKFKANNKLDIVHTVFLTDGEPTGTRMNSYNTHYTKNNFTFDSVNGIGLQDNMIQMFREYTGSKAIQFFICDSKSYLPHYPYRGTDNSGDQYSNDFKEAEKLYVKEGWAIASERGTSYNAKFIIKTQSVNEDDLEGVLSTRTSNIGIRNAFVKAMNSTVVSRVMLNRFIDLIATE